MSLTPWLSDIHAALQETLSHEQAEGKPPICACTRYHGM
jgi:hypothetical protein